MKGSVVDGGCSLHNPLLYRVRIYVEKNWRVICNGMLGPKEYPPGRFSSFLAKTYFGATQNSRCHLSLGEVAESSRELHIPSTLPSLSKHNTPPEVPCASF